MTNEKEKKKGPGGRPTKFKKEYCKMVIDHMEQGYSFESFAGILSVNSDTIHHWCKLFPEFSDAKDIGVQKSRAFWESLAIKNIINTTETIGLGPDKKVVSKALNGAVWVFNMKNRFGWADKKEIVTEKKPQKLVINLDTDDE